MEDTIMDCCQLDTTSTQSAAKISPPITLLQEICSRNGLTPDYQLLSTEGSVHEPTFKIAVTVADISAIASGQSKKKARHAAARDAIEKLRLKKDLNFEGINFETLAPVEEEEVTQSAYSTAINEANPVGKLQEICMKMRVNPPDYETCDERGLAHERVFFLSCRIASLNLSTMGQGRSKKLAKRQAAELMLAQLESSGIYDKTAINNKTKADQGVESLFIDSDDNTHFVKTRCQASEFITALDCTESELWKDIEMIEKDDVNDDTFYNILQETIPDGYYTEFHYINDYSCILHIYESCEPEPVLVISSFGCGDSEVSAMKQAVINGYKTILVLKNPLAKNELSQYTPFEEIQSANQQLLSAGSGSRDLGD
uniref:RISC-loading complex subunit tarbp2 n=1 Tax=Aceria tosichella TaxID=561515 RepID=A0A6G1SGI2_9ACAR